MIEYPSIPWVSELVPESVLELVVSHVDDESAEFEDNTEDGVNTCSMTAVVKIV